MRSGYFDAAFLDSLDSDAPLDIGELIAGAAMAYWRWRKPSGAAELPLSPVRPDERIGIAIRKTKEDIEGVRGWTPEQAAAEAVRHNVEARRRWRALERHGARVFTQLQELERTLRFWSCPTELIDFRDRLVQALHHEAQGILQRTSTREPRPVRAKGIRRLRLRQLEQQLRQHELQKDREREEVAEINAWLEPLLRSFGDPESRLEGVRRVDLA
jgi:hypothetical protein